MVDDTPFLDHQPSSLLKKPTKSMDSMIEHSLGKFGRAQFVQALLVSLSWFFDAQQTFISTFTDSYPAWHYTTDPNMSIPYGSGLCGLPDGSWAWDDYTDNTSMIMEWELQCASPFIRGLPATSFFAGCLTGGFILATLADSSLGRRNLLLLSCFSMGVSSLFTAFSNSIRIYAGLRFVSGFWRAAVGSSALVLSTELVGRPWQGLVGTAGFLGFSVGFLSLPAIAYTNRGQSWRYLYLWTSIPTLFYCILAYYLVRESPRWLLVRGRKDEAFEVLQSLASPEQKIQLKSTFFCTDDNIIDDSDSLPVDASHFSAMKLLLTRPWSIIRMSLVMAVGFGTGMVYYGMPLGLGNLSFNLYMSVAFNALSEITSTLVAMFLVTKLSRRLSLLIMITLCAAFSFACTVRIKSRVWLQMGFELLSFGSGCSALSLLNIYTLELFPTCIRNSALSMLRQAAMLGATFSPMLVAAGRASGGPLSYWVFGAVVGCGGLFTAFLPETHGGTLCDTMEEEEMKMKQQSASLD